jgi:excinuclease ABC subunit A
MSWFRDELVNNAYKFDFPIHKPYYELTRAKELIWTGNKYFQGLNDFFKELEAKIIKYRIEMLSYRGKPNVIPAKESVCALKLLMLKSIRRLFLT